MLRKASSYWYRPQTLASCRAVSCVVARIAAISTGSTQFTTLAKTQRTAIKYAKERLVNKPDLVQGPEKRENREDT